MKQWKAHIVAAGIISFLVMAFFSRLFWPTQTLIMTQDFGRSDIWHAGLPYRYFLWESLQNKTLPLWNPYQGGGFPVFSESLSGALFIPNTILFTFLDFVTAYNLSLILSFIMLGWGTYLLFRVFRLSWIASLFGGVTLVFSGLPFAQISHIMILQSVSMLPWIMITTIYVIKTPSILTISILSLAISQQLFAGFPQISFITLLLCFGFVVWQLVTKRIRFMHVLYWIISVALSGLLSAIQLLPSLEFLNYTTNPHGFSPQDAMYFSFPFKHIASLFYPFIFGSPSTGTYPPFYLFDGSLFWENTTFIGWLPFLGIILLFIKRTFLTKQKRQLTRFFTVVLAVSFLLMTGSHSPLYVIYAIWPFSLFRVPSRFLWTYIFSLVGLACLGLDQLVKQHKSLRILPIILGILGVIHVFQTTAPWYHYNPYVDARVWLTEPSIISILKQHSLQTIVSIGAETTHNKSFLTKGWVSMTPYWELRNTLTPTSNVFWHINAFKVYAGRFLTRQSLTESLFDASIDIAPDIATTSATTKRLMALFGIDALISTVPTLHTDLLPIASSSASSFSMTLYQLQPVHSGPYIATSTAVITTIKEASSVLLDKTFDPHTMALVEKPLSLKPLSVQPHISSITSQPTLSIYTVNDNPTASLLVTRETYYPGWTADIDGKQTEILPVNIRHKGVIIPEGSHTITFTYTPASVRTGAYISIVTVIVLLFLTGWQLCESKRRISL